MRQAVLLIAILVFVGGCGGSNEYAGISKDEALGQAKRAVIRYALGGDSSQYDADGVEVRDILKKTNSQGQDAWVVAFHDKYGFDACVHVWRATQGADQVDFEERQCP